MDTDWGVEGLAATAAAVRASMALLLLVSPLEIPA